MRAWRTPLAGNFQVMAETAARAEPTSCAEQRSFDPDAWGASPNWDPDAEQSVYDDSDLDRELVPLARSILSGEATAE
jgi:hypothetical protein